MTLVFSDRSEARLVSSRTDEHIKKLRPRLDLLPAQDRILIELIATGERSLREVARMTNVDAGVICRRVRSLLRRLHDPLVVHLMDPRCPLTPEYRQLGIEHRLLGLSLQEIAEKHRVRPSILRQSFAYLNGYAKGKSLGGNVRSPQPARHPRAMPAIYD